MKRTTGPLFVVSVTLLVLVVILGWVYRPQPEKVATAQQVAAAEALLQQLKTPSSATFDQYATACGLRSRYCVTSGRASPEALLDNVIDQLRSAGATVKQQACERPQGATPGVPLCSALLRFHGADVTLLASDRTPLGYSTPAWLLAATEQPNIALTASKPLETWNSLRVAPAAWHLNPTCVAPVAAGCNAYSATLTVTGTPVLASEVFRAALTAGGYRTDMVRCTPTSVGSEAHCLVVGSRFRLIGGLDGVSVSANISELDTTHSSVRLSATPR